MEFAYPDIGKMRGTLEDYGIKCDNSPLAFIQATYKVIMTIQHPDTADDLRDYLSSILEDYIYADGERSDEVERAKLNSSAIYEFENGAFGDWWSDEAEKHERDEDS